MSREALARKVGVAPSYIREFENGREEPSGTTIVRLAEGLGVSEVVALAFLRVSRRLASEYCIESAEH